MKIIRLTEKALQMLGEGRVYSKKDLKLKEGVSDGKVSLTLNPNGQDVQANSVQTSANNMFNRVPQATAVTVQSNDIKGVTVPTFSNSDPRSDTVQTIAAKNATSATVQNAAKNGGTIQITKDNQNNLGESRIMKMRENSIPFTKKELNEFLNSL